MAFTGCSPTHTSAPTPSSPPEIADAPTSLPTSADVNLLPYGKGRVEEFRNPKYWAATEGCIHASVAISLPEGSTISLTLESDCPIDWYGDWDNPRPQIGILFPQMRTYTEDSGWATICSRAMETRHIMSSNGGKRVEVMLTVHPDNGGASIPNIYKLLAVNFDPDSSHYLKYSISSYTAVPLPPVPAPILDVEIREVKIHNYRPSYDAEGRADPNFIEATFSWITNKPCYFWFIVKPVSFDTPESGAGTGIQLFDVSHPLPQSFQIVEHSHDILLRPGALHRYELTVWDREKNSARREATFQAEGVSIPASSPQPGSSIDEIFLSRWGHTYYNNAPRVSFSSFDIDKLILQTSLQVPWQLCYQAGVFDCSEMTAYLEYMLERHGYTAQICQGECIRGEHAWILVYNNVARCWMPIEATSPAGTLEPIFFHILTGGMIKDHYTPRWRWEDIYDVRRISEYDWWNSPYADKLVAASDKAKVGEPLPPLPDVKPPKLPPLPEVKPPKLPPLPDLKG